MEIFGQENQKPAKEIIRPIHRGIWADRLDNAQELPLGGSLFSNELTLKLELDFSAFDEQFGSFTEENIKKAYEHSKDSIRDWLEKIGSDIDPYTYFVCWQVQQRMHKLLEVDQNASAVKISIERKKMYGQQKPPKISELKGKTECGERAAMGQYLLQRIGVESAYVSGITMQDVKDIDEYPENHSFIVLKHPTKTDSTLIFDIARLRSQQVPRVLETDIPFTYELLKEKDELLVGATEVLQGGRLWFGVGEPVAGQHKTIEKNKQE